MAGHIIRIRGIVQGVGFRPAVWRIAREMGLAGDVRNDGSGVTIRMWGGDVETFVGRIGAEAPVLSRIESVQYAPLAEAAPGDGFEIVTSVASAPETGIAPDAATCPECLVEIADSAQRRYRYPFANCTNCGPRLTIIASLPYDRRNTSMAGFAMCPHCAREYADPADRRFHAQPIACPRCGPRLWIENRDGEALGIDAIAEAVRLIAAGGIVAIKGIGGFHLACDAAHEAAVATLRARKNRLRKPFALMARDVEMVSRFADLNDRERRLLEEPAAPILLLARNPNQPPLASAIAPEQRVLGFMLPYTPLHHLLMQSLDRPIVLTSGNLFDEPQCSGNAEARRRLGKIADAFVMHNRNILNRADDSVVRAATPAPIVLRRARGLAPSPLRLHGSFAGAPPVFAAGADLKATIAILNCGSATVSQHIGDLATHLAREDYGRTAELYLQLFKFAPAAIAADLHPDFHSTREAARLAEHFGCPLIFVQHHHAHIAAAMAENGLGVDAGPVLGIALDGAGLGVDGAIWGGEFLIANYRAFERVAHFAYVPLPGGDQAARQPWRNAYAHLSSALGWKSAAEKYGAVPAIGRLCAKPLGVLDRLADARLNAPLCSSAGRLFDAVAALLGVCFETQDYEGEAASLLESLATTADDGAAYDVEARNGELIWSRLFAGILDDLAHGVAAPIVARRFHRTLVTAIAREAVTICRSRNISQVALSGGCFNNALLLEGLYAALSRAGFAVLIHRQMPPGDGGVSLGQAAIAAATAL